MFDSQVSIPHLEKTCAKKTISLPQVRFKQINVNEIIKVFEHEQWSNFNLRSNLNLNFRWSARTWEENIAFKFLRWRRWLKGSLLRNARWTFWTFLIQSWKADVFICLPGSHSRGMSRSCAGAPKASLSERTWGGAFETDPQVVAEGEESFGQIKEEELFLGHCKESHTGDNLNVR